MIVLAGNFFLRLAIVFLIAIFTLTHGLLYAQTVSDSLEPVSLIPNKILENTDVDKASDRNIETLSEKGKTSDINDDSVEIKKLGEIDSDAVGISERLDGQFLSNMWQGTSRDVAERLINNIPDRIASEAAQSLARRILLVAAAPPVNDDSNKSLVLARVKKLIALGAVEDAERLLRVVSANTVPENQRGTCPPTTRIKAIFNAVACPGTASFSVVGVAPEIIEFESSKNIISSAKFCSRKDSRPLRASSYCIFNK